MKKLILMSIAALMLAGCQSQPSMPEGALVCEDPRPQMCTMDYTPACGHHSDGKTKTYSNSCSACAKPDVSFVIAGECKQ
ncbi:hypothetical protein ACMXYW_04465 [Neptuniibacter sp. QD48_55]|uniref:hypothetical protein n=1 Tax=Neptuniibacter sp. QD48_55 TaxID=3398212 RepID=UPI0039F47A44